MKNLKERITEALEENEDAGQELMNEENPWSTFERQWTSDWKSYTESGDAKASFAPDVAMEMVDQHGGEGEGDDYYSVWEFTSGDEKVYVKFQGWYASHVGSEYQDYQFVTPKSKTITVYE